MYVELAWYDGPRFGLADVDGEPHYFQNDDYGHADETNEHRVRPADEVAVKLEREQWAIFARWNQRYEAGTVTTESHPGHGGIDARYDEVTLLLAPRRQESCAAVISIRTHFFVGPREPIPSPSLLSLGAGSPRGPSGVVAESNMPGVTWEDPFCAEGSACFRLDAAPKATQTWRTPVKRSVPWPQDGYEFGNGPNRCAPVSTISRSTSPEAITGCTSSTYAA